jgi:hypothetical protein
MNQITARPELGKRGHSQCNGTLLGRNTSVTAKRLQEEAKRLQEEAGTDGTIVTSTITTGVRSALRRSVYGLIPHFRKAADVIGVYTWIVGLFANEFVLTCLDKNLPFDMADTTPSSSWKTFYDQIWSAFDGKSNRHQKAVKEFLKRHRGVLHNASQAERDSASFVLPRPVAFDMRGNACSELQRAALMHIQGDCGFLWKRARVHILHRFADAQATQHGCIHENTKKIGKEIVDILTGGEEPGNVSRLRTRLEGEEALLQLLLSIIREERDHMGDTKFESKFLERTFTHSRRYSLWSEAWCNRWYVDKETSRCLRRTLPPGSPLSPSCSLAEASTRHGEHRSRWTPQFSLCAWRQRCAHVPAPLRGWRCSAPIRRQPVPPFCMADGRHSLPRLERSC